MDTPAATYERFMVPVLFGPWAARIVELAQPQPGARVLDVACGTGIVARTVYDYVNPGGSVTGLDASANMLEVANSEGSRDGRQFEWRQGVAESLPFRMVRSISPSANSPSCSSRIDRPPCRRCIGCWANAGGR